MTYLLVLCCLLPLVAVAQDVRWDNTPRLQFEAPELPPGPVLPLDPVVTGPPPSAFPTPPPPLFSRQTVARDTPALLLDALNDPTPDKVRAYADWHIPRLLSIQRVQQLLKEYAGEKEGR